MSPFGVRATAVLAVFRVTRAPPLHILILWARHVLAPSGVEITVCQRKVSCEGSMGKKFNLPWLTETYFRQFRIYHFCIFTNDPSLSSSTACVERGGEQKSNSRRELISVITSLETTEGGGGSLLSTCASQPPHAIVFFQWFPAFGYTLTGIILSAVHHHTWSIHE